MYRSKIHRLFSLLILYCLTVHLSTQQATTVSSRTFFGNESYTQYPSWAPSPQRILRLTFKTSELNGLLVYSREPEGDNFQDSLLVRLAGGSLEVELSLDAVNTVTAALGRNTFLNDNEEHTLTIFQNPDLRHFELSLDAGSPVLAMYPINLTPQFGADGVFVGGVPPDVDNPSLPLNNEVHFIGCISDVLFASGDNFSIGMNSSMLESRNISGREGVVQDNCVEPCLAASLDCGPGVCVNRWPDRAFCDCRAAERFGPTCEGT